MSNDSRRRSPQLVVAERRRSRRIQLLLAVEVEIAGVRQLAVVTQLCPDGARIELPGAGMGDALTIRRNGVELQARIVWTAGTAAGLSFPDPLDARSFLQLRRQAAA